MIFISHSTANDKFVNQLAEDLQIRGFKTWVDHLDMPAGSRWVAQLESALMESDVMLLVLSQEAIQSSYVESEWHTFFNMGRKIVPLVIDDCDVPLFLRTFHQVDFRPNQIFHKQMELLLQVLPENLDRTIRSNPLQGYTGMLPTPKSHTQVENMRLSHDEILLLSQEVIDNKALTLRTRTIQFILPLEDTILQYPLMDEFVIGRSHRSAQFQPTLDLNPYKNSCMISRHHVTLYFEDRCLYIKDNSSTNGTYIENVALAPNEYYPLDNYSLIYLSRQFPIMVRYQV